MEGPVIAQEEVLGKIVSGAVFNSWDEIKELRHLLRKVCFMPTTWESKKTVESYNKKKGVRPIDESKFKYQSGNLRCSHYGEHRDRGKGIRPNQNVLACDCPWGFRVAFNSWTHKYNIQWANLEHKGHPISEEFIDHYDVKRTMDPDAITFAERALEAGAVPARIRKQLQIDFGRDVSTKFLQNLKQKLQGVNGNEWGSAAQLLYEEGKQPGAVVKVLHENNEEQTINLIYIQLAEQRKMFQKYGELVQIDGTYSLLTNLDLPLYTILYEDNHGLGQPAAFFFVRKEATEFIEAGLQIFAQHNDVSVTQIVLLDKDSSEIVAAEKIFTNAKIYLCHFHVLQAVKRRLDKDRLPLDYRNYIYFQFEECVYSKLFNELEDFAAYLCNLEDGLGDYFADCWFKKPEMWAIQFRKEAYAMENNTTNRIERFHRTIKDILDHKKVKLLKLLTHLLDIVRFRLVDKSYKEKLTRIRFKTNKPPAELEELSNLFTHYAYKLVLAQRSLPSTSYSSIKLSDRFSLTSWSGCYRIDLDLSKCSCTFSVGFGLPCRHIMYLAEQEKRRLPIEKYNHRWKISDEDADIILPIRSSPLTGVLRLKNKRPTTQQEQFCQANLITRSLANLLSDLPWPVAQGYLCLLQQIGEAIKSKQPIRLLQGESRSPLVQHLDAEEPQRQSAAACTPRQNISINDSLREVLSPMLMNGNSSPPQRPSSLGIHQEVVTTIVRIPTPLSGVTAVVTVTTPTDGPTTVAVAVEQPGPSSELHALPSPPLPRPTTVTVSNSMDQPGPSSEQSLPSYSILDQRFVGRRGPRPRQKRIIEEEKSLEPVPTNPVTSNEDNPPGPSTSTPGSGTKRKLEALTLPAKRRRAGPSRKAKQLFKYKLTPKSFVKKKRNEKNLVFLTWFVGKEKAETLMSENLLAEESDLITMPEDISNGVIGKEVLDELDLYKNLFTEDAWICVNQTIEVKKKMCPKCPKCKRSANKTAKIIRCDSCLQFHHWKCEGITSKPKAALYTCSTCQQIPIL